LWYGARAHAQDFTLAHGLAWASLVQVKQGDRIAQLVLERIYTPPVVQTDDLDATVRGAGGLGSTGGFGNA
jgi:dUTPase